MLVGKFLASLETDGKQEVERNELTGVLWNGEVGLDVDRKQAQEKKQQGGRSEVGQEYV
jgi:hypothetical protein